MLEVKKLRKVIKNRIILNDISFSLKNGEIGFYCGNNGSGKTTTFRIIAGLMDPDGGEVWLDDKAITKRDVAYLSEERAIYLDCDLQKQANLILRMNGIEETEARMDYWLQYLQLSNYQNIPVGRLSKGNKQKAALFLCLIKCPKVLILDEPFTALDSQNCRLFSDAILQLAKQGTIILISTHQSALIEPLYSRCMLIQQGKLVMNVARQDIACSKKAVIESETENMNLRNTALLCLNTDHKTKYIYRDIQNARQALSLLDTQVLKGGVSLRRIGIEDLLEVKCERTDSF